jgi:uncharacterized protein
MPNDRIERIAEFVERHLHKMAREYPSTENNPVYRWEHTLRVAHYGKEIALAEGADIEQVIAACLLHDVAHFESDDDYKDHGRRGAKIARSILKELGYEPAPIDNICYAIAVHVDGEADFDHPYTIEAKCVTDADNVDRFGAYRVLQWCVPEMEDFPALAAKLTQRIEQLKEYRATEMLLETPTGDHLFKEQLDRQITFFEALVKEFQITSLQK